MKTTLKKIKEHLPCEDGWEKLLSSLNKAEADDEELSLLTILESNGLSDALWALRAVEGKDKEIRLMACDFAESVVYLMKDERSVNAIKVSRNYANGIATKEELNAAKYFARAAAAAARAAWNAAARAAWNAAKYFDRAADAANWAAEAADWAAWNAAAAAEAAARAARAAAAAADAAARAAEAAARAADWAAGAAEREKQKEIFKKYVQ